MKLSKTLALFALLSLLPQVTFANIEVPEEELAKESVLPRFDRGEAVKNRNIPTAGRFEVGGYGGWNFTEPIYNQMKFGANIGYHFDETHALMFNFSKWMDGRNSQYTDLLAKQGLDFGRTPNMEFSAWANYEMKAYYGKISMAKSLVSNMHLYPILGAGVTKYSHKMYPGLNGGVGMKFYFSKNFALRFDAKLQFQQGVNPFLKDKLKTSNPRPDAGDFSDKFSLGTIFDFGFSFLL